MGGRRIKKAGGTGGKLVPTLLAYLLTLFVVAEDQLTKYLTVTHIKPRETVPLIEGVLHFTYVENTGAAFGIMKNSRWVFMAVSSIAIVALIILIARFASEDRFAAVTIAMILGGGIGNMIDRVRLGYVVDFIDLRLINFAVFNVADSFVTVGSVLLIVILVREFVKDSRTRNGKDEKDESGNADGDTAGNDDPASATAPSEASPDASDGNDPE